MILFDIHFGLTPFWFGANLDFSTNFLYPANNNRAAQWLACSIYSMRFARSIVRKSGENVVAVQH